MDLFISDNMDLGIKDIEKLLDKKEKTLDVLYKETREAVRNCAHSIKSMHAKEFRNAAEYLKKAEATMKKLKPYQKDFKNHLNIIYQEYVEATVLLALIKSKPLPNYKNLGIPPEAFLTGLLDCVGELKREMYENLRKGDKKEAERFFHSMEWIFHELLHLRFSNAVLPEFRKKQDIARIQIEQARGELI